MRYFENCVCGTYPRKKRDKYGMLRVYCDFLGCETKTPVVEDFDLHEAALSWNYQIGYVKSLKTVGGMIENL